MNVGSLFSGIGGFDYGLERAGFTTSWFCEQNEFGANRLRTLWPGCPVYPDITELRGCDVEPVDALCGGFPCQDLSLAGKGAGLDGARSGLWSEYARLIGELRPRYVFVENVPALLGRGVGRVLGDLAALGYDTEWDCIPASALGAPHRRDRFWLVAYPGGEGLEGHGRTVGDESQVAHALGESVGGGDTSNVAYPRCESCRLEEHRSGGQGRQPADTRESALVRQEDGSRCPKGSAACNRTGHVADTNGSGRQGRAEDITQAGTKRSAGPAERSGVGDPESIGRGSRGTRGFAPASERERIAQRSLQDTDSSPLQPWRIGGGVAQTGGPEWWSVEPPVGRVAHGVPDRLAHLAALGNALVPFIAEWIGRQVMTYEANQAAVAAPKKEAA